MVGHLHEGCVPAYRYRVQLAVSRLGGVPRATAYHSSVIVNGIEYSFGDKGIYTNEGPASHRAPPRITDMGSSHRSGCELHAKLAQYFEPGTYDLIRKNCNSFSDVALFFLLRKRLDQQYRTLERLGSRRPSLVQAISIGKYSPNPDAGSFDLEDVVADLDPTRVWQMHEYASPQEALHDLGFGCCSAATNCGACIESLSTAAGPGGSPGPAGVVAGDDSLARQLQAAYEQGSDRSPDAAFSDDGEDNESVASSASSQSIGSCCFSAAAQTPRVMPPRRSMDEVHPVLASFTNSRPEDTWLDPAHEIFCC